MPRFNFISFTSISNLGCKPPKVQGNPEESSFPGWKNSKRNRKIYRRSSWNPCVDHQICQAYRLSPGQLLIVYCLFFPCYCFEVVLKFSLDLQMVLTPLKYLSPNCYYYIIILQKLLGTVNMSKNTNRSLGEGKITKVSRKFNLP